MDKSFEGLLASLALHALLVWLVFMLPSVHLPTDADKTEVTFIDAPHSKAKSIVTETEKTTDTLQDVKDSADLLSQLTKRVKKQMRARLNGPTRNSHLRLNPTLNSSDREQIKGTAGMDKPQIKTEDGVGPRIAGGGGQAIHTVAIGPSSIAEYIPSVEEGDFTALNTDQFTYYSFFARINEQVRNRWITNIRNYVDNLTPQMQTELAKRDRQTVIEIVLDRKGGFSTSIVGQSSGDRTLDQTTVEAFRAAAPFLNPPKGMIENDGLIHLHYGFVVRFRPPFGQAGFQ